MQRRILLLSTVLIFCFSFFTACSPKEEQSLNNTTPRPTDSTLTVSPALNTQEGYSDKGDVFRKLYEKAQSDVKNGMKPDSDAPESPDATGFALVPLGEELYGIDYLAILPVLSRDLTDTEVLQLAYKMDGISFDELISPAYSFMDGSTQMEYRPLQWEERVRRYGLEKRFQFEGTRPSENLNNNASSGNPIYVEIKNFGKYWIYPKAAMTDEQLLEVINSQFNVGEEYFKPLDTQIQYADLEKTLNQLISEYKLSDEKLEAYYPYYMTQRYIENQDPKYPDYWYVRLHFSEGYDYNINFYADGGALISWVRVPKDYYDEKEPTAFTTNLNNNTTKHTDEEIVKAAEAYATDAILKDGVTIAGSKITQKFDEFNYGGGLISDCKGAYVTVTFSNADIYRIAVLEDDLAIQRVEIQSSMSQNGGSED